MSVLDYILKIMLTEHKLCFIECVVHCLPNVAISYFFVYFQK